MKKRILAMMLVLMMIISAVGCSNVATSTANNHPGNFIYNAVDNTERRYDDSIGSVSSILSSALRGGNVKVSYNDANYSFDNIFYMDYPNAKYVNLLDGQIYGEDVNLTLTFDKSDVYMQSNNMLTYQLYEGEGYDSYKFTSDMVAGMLSDNYNESGITNPTNFDWLMYQLTRLMQINEEFDEQFDEAMKDLFNEKFIRYSAESTDVDIDGNAVACVVLKYNLDEYDIADILDTVLTQYSDYFYYLGATGVKNECFVITDTIEKIKEYVEKSFANLDFTLTVAKDTEAIVSLAVSGNLNIAGEEANVSGELNLGRVASYFTPVTGSITLSNDQNTYEFSLKTDAASDDTTDTYRLYAEFKDNGTTEDFVDLYFTYNKGSDKNYELYSNTNGSLINCKGTLVITEDKKFEIKNNYAKIGNDEYFTDLTVLVKAEANMPATPSKPSVIYEEYDEEGLITYSAADALKDIAKTEIQDNGGEYGVLKGYESLRELTDKIIRNSIFKNAAEGIGDFIEEKLSPAIDDYKNK